jgi:hypothetical protein
MGLEGKRRSWTWAPVVAALAGGLASAAAAGQGEAKNPGVIDREEAPKGGVATAASLAQALDRLRNVVHIDPTQAGGRFTLSYHLRDEPQKLDFEARDVQGPETSLVHGYGWKAALAEIASDDANGLFLNKVPFKGDFELDADFYIRCLDKDRSSFAFVVGYDTKTRRWLGARWGEQLVVCDGHRTVPEDGPADMTPYLAMRRAALKLVRKGNSVTLFLNGTREGSVTTPVGDGCWGLILQNVRVGFVRLAMTGTPDLPDPEAAKDAKGEKKTAKP